MTGGRGEPVHERAATGDEVPEREDMPVSGSDVPDDAEVTDVDEIPDVPVVPGDDEVSDVLAGSDLPEAPEGPSRPAPGSTVHRSPVDDAARRALHVDLAESIRGDVDFGAHVRAVYSTDSSNYRQVPLGVVFPRDEEDIAVTLRICAAYDAPVLARGAGTSLAGQACNVAVVLDTSRYLTGILEIDPEAGTARVQPGVVLDDLRRAASEYGLTFGPDPATHAWCTIGGMIGNNACGPHGLVTGRTVDNVASLRLALYGGEVLELGQYGEQDYADAITSLRPGSPTADVMARILGGLREIGRRVEPLVAEHFPPIDRRVSGFNLDEVLPGGPLHVARLLVGTESTCGVITEATVHLTALPEHRVLVVLGYPDLFAAADDVPHLLAAPLLALEGFDATLTDQMRARGLGAGGLDLLPEGQAWLLAELGGQHRAEVAEAADTLVAELPAHITWCRYDDPDDQGRLWRVRESALGATALGEGGRHNAEGWEDAAVPPARLGEYLREITVLWQQYGYHGAWYGHFGQGCVHTRNDFDLHTTAGLAHYRAYVERAADLVVRLGGSLSGEHGDGQARGELLERLYGPELVDAFRQVKALFDPRGRMNPGKVVDPYPLDTNLRFGPSYATVRSTRTHFDLARDGGSLQRAAERCVGVGACRRDDTGVMCPSYRATRDERHSTRGRARVLVEMFQGDVTATTWRNEDVRDALDLCLSCKGCVAECPTHVDMATYKAEFLSHYYAGRPRPRGLLALGLTPWLARIGSRLPRLGNLLLTAPGLRTVVRRTAGVTTRRPAPRLAARSLRRSVLPDRTPGLMSSAASPRLVGGPLLAPGGDREVAGAGPTSTSSAPSVPSASSLPSASSAGRRVVVWPDTFTDAYRPDLGHDLIAVLEGLGERVFVPGGWACCGRPYYDAGMLGQARRSLKRLLDLLQPWYDQEIPVVVPEPSCLAAFRDELPRLMSADPRAARLASLARSPAEHLLTLEALTGAAAALPPPGETVAVHPHCHSRPTGAVDADRALLELLGYRVAVADAGCCGMAGGFGYRAEHEALSRRIGQEQWLPRLYEVAAAADHLVIDGFSCTLQGEQLGGLHASTLVALVRRRLGL